MKSTLRMIVLVAFVGAGLGGCESSTRQASSDQDRCRSQGLAPSTQAFDDCMATAGADRHDAERRQSQRMQDSVNMQMDSFMHSSATSF